MAKGVTFENNQVKVDINLQAIANNGIFVALPMYGGQCFGSMAQSLVSLQHICTTYGIPLQYEMLFNESLVQRARNTCAAKFLDSPMKHFVFIDSDIEFKPMDLLSMLHLQNINDDMDILCAPYPKKVIAWEKVKKAVEMGYGDADPRQLENFASDFVFNALRSERTSIAEPLEILEGGTGYMAVKRSTFERFMEAYPEQKYVPDSARFAGFEGEREIYAFFDCVVDKGESPRKKELLVDLCLSGTSDIKTLKKKAQEIRKIEEKATRRYLSEDYFFCQKVRQAGMKVWLAPWIFSAHNGFYRYSGSMSALGAINATTSYDKDLAGKK